MRFRGATVTSSEMQLLIGWLLCVWASNAATSAHCLRPPLSDNFFSTTLFDITSKANISFKLFHFVIMS